MRFIFILLFFPISLVAEELITGNLITNGTFESGNANGWTQSGNGQVLSDCCGSSYDYEFGDSGSIEQSFDLISDTINQTILNNGITLNSNVQVQNGECAVAGCWGGQGDADSFTIRLQIRDSDNNVLSSSSQTRTDTTNINGQSFLNSVSYSDAFSNIGNLKISGVDANAPAYLGGANFDNISVTMTYDDTVLSAIQTNELQTTVKEIEETLGFTNEIFPEVEVLFVEEIIFEVEEPKLVVQMIEEIFIEELSTKEIQSGIINVFKEPELIENFEKEEVEMENLYEEFETTEIELPEQQVQETTRTENAEISTRSEETIIEESIEENKIEKKEPESEIVVAENNTAQKTESENEVTEDTEITENVESEVPDQTQNAETTDTVEQNEVNISVSVDNVIKKIDKLSVTLDKKMAMTSIIIAKAISSNNNSIDSYGKVHENIFNQRVIDGGQYEQSRVYLDNRNLYAENQNISLAFDNKVSRFYEEVDQAVKKRIIAEEHLRSIRGY